MQHVKATTGRIGAMESTKGSSLPCQSWHHAYVCPPISKYTWTDKHLWDEGAKKNEGMQCQIIIHNNLVMPWTARALATRVSEYQGKKNKPGLPCLFVHSMCLESKASFRSKHASLLLFPQHFLCLLLAFHFAQFVEKPFLSWVLVALNSLQKTCHSIVST